MLPHDRSNPLGLQRRADLPSVLHSKGDLQFLWVEDLKCLSLHLASLLHQELQDPRGSLWGLMNPVVLLPVYWWPRALSRGQQTRSCSQYKRAQGIVGEGLSEPRGASAALPATPLTPLDLPCRQPQGSLSSWFRFFEGEGRGLAEGGTAALPVDPKYISIPTPPEAGSKPTFQPRFNQRKKRKNEKIPK